MIEVIFLGTGGSLASRERDNTAFILKTGEGTVLIDCPGSVIQKMLRVDVDPLHVGAVFVTHVHPDHVYGLPSLIHSLMLRDHVIRLFGSPETTGFCRDLLDLFHLRKPRFKTRVEFVPLGPGNPAARIADLDVSSLRVPHHDSSLSFQFRSTEGEKRIVFSGDTPIHSELFTWARGADALFHDCSGPSRYFRRYPALSVMHTHSLDLGIWSERAQIRRLFPCHFLGELDFEIAEIEEEIKPGFRGPLFIPSDLDKVVID